MHQYGVLLVQLFDYQLEVDVMNRFSITLSDDLNREIEKAARESETNKNEILRKALQLYLAAYDGKKKNKKLGLVNPETNQLETEIIGLRTRLT
jgi:metal-responsive CopG/Arc/MetJ family transcriptional regulator